MIWTIFQIIFGIGLIGLGIFGLVVPIIPGLFFIFVGTSLILHLSIKKAWSVFRDRVLT